MSSIYVGFHERDAMKIRIIFMLIVRGWAQSMSVSTKEINENSYHFRAQSTSVSRKETEWKFVLFSCSLRGDELNPFTSSHFTLSSTPLGGCDPRKRCAGKVRMVLSFSRGRSPLQLTSVNLSQSFKYIARDRGTTTITISQIWKNKKNLSENRKWLTSFSMRS